MANNKSAKRRIKINKRNRLRNKYYKTSLRTLIKLFFLNLEIYKNAPNAINKQKAQAILSSIFSFLDKGSKKNIFHRNMVARKKSRLTFYLQSVL